MASKHYLEFPFRNSFMTVQEARDKLAELLTCQPIITREEWKIPNGKVVWEKYENSIEFPLSHVVAHPATPFGHNPKEFEKNHWNIDKVIDFYTEMSRVSSPGYGETFSPIRAWKEPKFIDYIYRQLAKNHIRATPEKIRDQIAKTLQEARPAYVTVTLSIISAFCVIAKSARSHSHNSLDEIFDNSNLLKSPVSSIGKDLRILDVAAAYGERRVASRILGASAYVGIDPDDLLVQGHSRLMTDLNSLISENSSDCTDLWTMPFERFDTTQILSENREDSRTTNKFDIIMVSPPPFMAEPYTGGGMFQSHRRYKSVSAWFAGFVMTMLIKCKHVISNDGVFAITMLDRTEQSSNTFGKIREGQLRFLNRSNSDIRKSYIQYTELTLLAATCLGFNYLGALGYSTGGKPASTPWWIFRNSSDSGIYQKRRAFDKIIHAYGDLAKDALGLIAWSSGLDPVNISTMVISDYKIIGSTSFLASYDSYDPSILKEIVRHSAIKQIVQILNASILRELDFFPQKEILIKRIPNSVARWIMTAKASHETFETPNASGSLIDPLIPSFSKNHRNNKELISYLIQDLTYDMTDQLLKSNQVVEKLLKVFGTNRYSIGNSAYIQSGFGLCGLLQSSALCLSNLFLTQPFEILKFDEKIFKFPSQMPSTVLEFFNLPAIREFNQTFTTLQSSVLEIADEMKKPKHFPLLLSDVVELKSQESRTYLDFIMSALRIRYMALGAESHHFTRPLQRINILSNIASIFLQTPPDQQVTSIDMFATASNTNTPNYFSPAFDLEQWFGSFGSAFTSKFEKDCLIMANPVDYTPFVILAMNKISQILQESSKSKTNLVVSVGFTIWLDKDSSFMTQASKNLMEALSNSHSIGLKLCGTDPILRSYVRSAYALDHNKFPTQSSASTISTARSSLVQSIGVILTTRPMEFLKTSEQQLVMKLINDLGISFFV